MSFFSLLLPLTRRSVYPKIIFQTCTLTHGHHSTYICMDALKDCILLGGLGGDKVPQQQYGLARALQH